MRASIPESSVDLSAEQEKEIMLPTIEETPPPVPGKYGNMKFHSLIPNQRRALSTSKITLKSPLLRIVSGDGHEENRGIIFE